MFTIDAAIDTVQNGKKTLVNAFVFHDGLKDAMVNFIDAQTAYTKDAFRATNDMVNAVSKETFSAVHSMIKTDYTK